MHWRKSIPRLSMVRGEFGGLTRGEITRFNCTLSAIETMIGNSTEDSLHVLSALSLLNGLVWLWCREIY